MAAHLPKIGADTDGGIESGAIARVDRTVDERWQGQAGFTSME